MIGVAIIIAAAWLFNTPPGLLGKADAIGYAICHRISTRSFFVGEVQMPLCARCSGMYLGVLVGLGVMVALGAGRAGRLPRPWVLVGLAIFVAIMGVDGVNSYLQLIPGLALPRLYEPQNWLRAVTGILTGVTMAALVLPSFNQALWANWNDRPVLRNLRELALVVGVAAVVIILLLTDIDVILYPLALLSALGVGVILTMINTIILLMVTRQDARAFDWRGAWLPLLAATTLSIVQIGLVDAARYAVFQSWDGLVFPTLVR